MSDATCEPLCVWNASVLPLAPQFPRSGQEFVDGGLVFGMLSNAHAIPTVCGLEVNVCTR